jgi:hypothetical protein
LEKRNQSSKKIGGSQQKPMDADADADADAEHADPMTLLAMREQLRQYVCPSSRSSARSTKSKRNLKTPTRTLHLSEARPNARSTQ